MWVPFLLDEGPEKEIIFSGAICNFPLYVSLIYMTKYMYMHIIPPWFYKWQILFSTNTFTISGYG